MGIWGKLKNRQAAVKESATSVATEESEKPKTKKADKPKKPATVNVASEVKHQQVTSEFGHRVLLRPLITEKSSHLHSMNQYVFQVATNATKMHVKKAIEEVFGVKPVAVRIVSKQGKRVNFRRTTGQRAATKKAIVTLPKGQTIKIYEGV